MKYYKTILFIFGVIFFIFSESTLFSQDTSTNSNVVNKKMIKDEVSINYIKRSVPPKEGNSNGLDNDDNNFIGIGWIHNISLDNDNYGIILEFDTKIQ